MGNTVDTSHQRWMNIRVEWGYWFQISESNSTHEKNITISHHFGVWITDFFSFLLTVAATHRETQQFYNMYNTLADTKSYMEKELSLLNSILDNMAMWVVIQFYWMLFVTAFLLVILQVIIIWKYIVIER